MHSKNQNMYGVMYAERRFKVRTPEKCNWVSKIFLTVFTVKRPQFFLETASKQKSTIIIPF